MCRIWPFFALFIYTGCVSPQPQVTARKPAQASSSVYAQLSGLTNSVVVASGTDHDLHEVAGFEHDIWIIGDQILLHRVDEKFNEVALDGCPKKDFKNLNVNGDTVTVSCTLADEKIGRAKFDGKAWSFDHEPVQEVDRKTWRGEHDTWDVNGHFYVHDDGRLKEKREISKMNLNAVSGVKLGANHIWLVGEKGEILETDGYLWQEIASGTDANLFDVWISASGTAWIVGEDGLILRSTD